MSHSPKGSKAVSLLRPYQWVKNLFVAAPLLLTPDLLNWHNAVVVLGGVVCFCALSSGVYIINDIGSTKYLITSPIKF